MAIQAAELFSRDPARTIDFSGLSAGGIFNGLASSVNRFTPPRPAAATDDGMYDQPVSPQGDAYSPQDLFQPPERGLLPQNGPAPALGRTGAGGTNTSNTQPERQTDYNTEPTIPQGQYGDFTDFMFQSEARIEDGKLQVYVPPEGDGGGAYEVAGITAKYQPREAALLKSMIEEGRNDEAVAYAKDFYRKRAEPFTSLTGNKGLQLQFADAVHHRGEGGLRRILQRATGSDSRDYEELIGGLSAREDALEAFDQARRAYEWEEVDRGRKSRKKFRRGLENRFNNAAAAARSFL